jgi:hypothetical protein
MKLSTGDKFVMNAQEWTVLAGTVGGKKVWVGRLVKVISGKDSEIAGLLKDEYMERQLMEAEWEGGILNGKV